MEHLNTFKPDITTLIENGIKLSKLVNLGNSKIVIYPPFLDYLGDEFVSKYECFKLPIKWFSFADGTPNIEFFPVIKDRDIIFLFDTLNIKEMMPSLMVLQSISKYNIKSLNIIIPYYSVGTMERSEREGIIATAESMAKFISLSVSPTQTGRPRISLFDIHSIVERHYFTDNVIVEYYSGIDLLLDKITFSVLNKKKLFVDAIVFPDDGAYKRFNVQFPNEITNGRYKGTPVIICSKIRENGERKITINDIKNVDDKNFKSLLIVDDLIQTGGTLIECANCLKKRFKDCDISVYSTHAVFPKKNFDSFKIFKNVFITNSIHHENLPYNFVVLDLIDLFPKIIPDLIKRENKMKIGDVFVSSSDDRKLYGVYMFFMYELRYPIINLKYKPVTPYINQYPSKDEVLECLKNRHLQHFTDCEYKISVQNCRIEKSKEKHYDNCVSMFSIKREDDKFINKHGICTLGTSYDVEIDQDYVNDPNNRYNFTTYGKYMKHKYGCDDGDWYHLVEENPRWYMIYDSLLDAFINNNSWDFWTKFKIKRVVDFYQPNE